MLLIRTMCQNGIWLGFYCYLTYVLFWLKQNALFVYLRSAVKDDSLSPHPHSPDSQSPWWCFRQRWGDWLQRAKVETMKGWQSFPAWWKAKLPLPKSHSHPAVRENNTELMEILNRTGKITNAAHNNRLAHTNINYTTGIHSFQCHYLTII